MRTYLVGAILALGLKFGRDTYRARRSGTPFVAFLLNWIFEPSAENAVSWAVTIGCVWMLGSWIVGQFSFGQEPQTFIPLHPSVLFSVGALAEAVAPRIGEKLTSTIVSRFGEGSK